MDEKYTNEEQDPLFEENSSSEMQTWFQENLRVIVSVFIVGAIALGIYSYSQRTETLMTGDEESALVSEDTETESLSDEISAPSMKDTEVTKTPVEVSRETEGSFVETAVAGEGSTHLARHALANSLEKNPDSSLTAEHKIYIEDYLRKHVAVTGGVHPGTSIEFSKELINQAIESSKTLNDRQLNNLKKYSARVAAYR